MKTTTTPVSGVKSLAKSRATIADVASLAGVGLSTVSRVIRGAPSVSDKTLAKVEAAIEATGYQADLVARSLRNSGNLALVALIAPDLSDPYFSDIYMHLQESALERGDSLLVGSHMESLSIQRQLLEKFSAYRASTVVLVPAPGTTGEDIENLNRNGIPVVVLDRPVKNAQVDSVLADNEMGAESLVSALVTDGPARVGIVSLPRTIWTQERRYNTVIQALARRGIKPVISIEEAALTAPSGDAFRPLIDAEVSVVIALSVPPAMGVMRLESDGLLPLHGLGVFDRHPWFDLVRPNTVSVSQSSAEVAAQVDFFIEQRKKAPDDPPKTHILPFRRDGERSVS